MGDEHKILVADDDPVSRNLLLQQLEKAGFEVMLCEDGKEALEALDNFEANLIIADYRMPKMDGLELLEQMKERGYEIPFLIITAYGGIDSTLKAFELGATEYLTKPYDAKELILVVRKALNIGKMQQKLSRLESEVHEKYQFDDLIGQSPPMLEAFRLIYKASQSSANVLITGETGTGKELAAKAIHYNSARRPGPFVVMNCSAFSTGTLESELFGHVRGSFTGAVRDHKGRFERAAGGTLFLDEVGEIPLDIQVKLLRVLEEKTFERVGGQDTITSDFRLIAATNRDLKDMVQRALFREDLFYRLTVINLTMPSLREHVEDIPLLIRFFIKRYSDLNQKQIKTISLESLKHMQEYPWPGNVRQLENAIESAVALCDGEIVRMSDLPLELTSLPVEGEKGEIPPEGSLPDAVSLLEMDMIRRALHTQGGVKARAAKALSISERVLAYKIAKYNINPKHPLRKE